MYTIEESKENLNCMFGLWEWKSHPFIPTFGYNMLHCGNWEECTTKWLFAQVKLNTNQKFK